MSDNPFKNPESGAHPVGDVQYDPNQGSKKPDTIIEKPLALNAIATLCLILGVLGLIGVAFTILGAIFADQFMDFVPTLTDEQKEITKAIQQRQFIPNLLFMGLTALVSIALIVSAFGCLMDRPNGRSFFAKTLVVALIFVVLRTIFAIVLQFMNQADLVKASGGGAVGEQSFLIGIVFIVLFNLLIFGFYVVCYLIANTQAAKAYFGN